MQVTDFGNSVRLCSLRIHSVQRMPPAARGQGTDNQRGHADRGRCSAYGLLPEALPHEWTANGV